MAEEQAQPTETQQAAPTQRFNVRSGKLSGAVYFIGVGSQKLPRKIVIFDQQILNGFRHRKSSWK